MKVRAMAGNDEIATVYIAELEGGALVEFVESVQPPVPRNEKWVLILSTLIGCPAGCRFCDAGGTYTGKVSAGEMLEQIDFMVRRRYPDGRVPAPRFKVQFARMGEPSLNDGVIEVLEKLPGLYDAPGLIPALLKKPHHETVGGIIETSTGAVTGIRNMRTQKSPYPPR